LGWVDARWQAYIDQPGLETWVAYLEEDAIGYFELDPQSGRGVEIAYFGLLPPFIGRGLGGVLLTEAVDRGWEIQTERVWVHTCTLDHPQALANYLARGFEIYHRETHRAPSRDWPRAGGE
jgi:GNAT superfamily N-acetyltransferase